MTLQRSYQKKTFFAQELRKFPKLLEDMYFFAFVSERFIDIFFVNLIHFHRVN